MMVSMGRRNDDGHETAVGQRIARNVERLLRQRGWTQGQLAYKAGLPQSGISALMIGRRNPSLMSVWKVAQAFEVDIASLAGFTPLQIPETAPDQDGDRLGSIEERLARFESKFERFLEAAEQSVQPEAPKATHGRRRRTG